MAHLLDQGSAPAPPAALHDLPATTGERRASGRAARKRVRRGTLGSWDEDARGHDALATIVLNFGLWATPERNLSFDLRDFDETLPGPFEWDVKRFAASLVVAARENRLTPAAARSPGSR